MPALENNTLWDERDLTNSSCERIIFPEATILSDHIVTLSINVLGNLTFNEQKKIGRQHAHEIIRSAAMNAYESGDTISEALLKEPLLAEHLTKEQLEWMVRPENYVGTAPQQVERVVTLLRQDECLE
jgi:adenylosuccinate lyase